MKSELLKIADMLLSVMPKSNKEIISVYKHNVLSNNANTARIISDELVDYFAEMDDGSDLSEKKKALSEKLYNKTMEFYEINS